MSTLATTTAHVRTDRPHRYAKQLANHFGRKVEAQWSEDEGRGTLTFPGGEETTLLAGNDELILRIVGPAKSFERIEGIVGSHLERFGERGNLAVRWQREA